MPSPNSRSASPLRSASRRELHGAIGLQLGFGEEGLQVGLVRTAADHRDLLAFEAVRDCASSHVDVAPRDEARGRTVVGIAEIDPLARLGSHRERRDHGIGAVFGQRLQQRIEAAQLDGALRASALRRSAARARR